MSVLINTLKLDASLLYARYHAFEMPELDLNPHSNDVGVERIGRYNDYRFSAPSQEPDSDNFYGPPELPDIIFR